MSLRAIAFALLLTLPVAGCLGGSSGGPQPEDTFPAKVLRMDSGNCLDYMCRADPASPAVQQIREESGLDQLTDTHAGHGFIQVQDGWVVWQSLDPTLSYIRGDIWAMNLTTRELYGVRVGPGHSVRPFLDNGRVVFQYDSGLMEWQVGADTVQPLDIGIKGRYWLWDLEGDWVAISIGSNATANGEWAINTKTGQRHQLYAAPPKDSAIKEYVRDVDLSDDYAYHMLARYGDEPSYWLNQTKLANGEKRTYQISQESNGVAAGNAQVLIQSIPEFLRFDVAEATFFPTGLPNDDPTPTDCSFGTNSRDSKEWVSLWCNHPNGDVFKFYHLPDGAINEQDKTWLLYASMDGETMVFIGARKLGLDLFMKPVV